MNLTGRGFVALACILTLGGLALAGTKADPREKLDTAIPEAIRLLKAKEYATFLKRFVAPDDLKKITKRVTFEKLVKKFGEDKAAGLLATLESIKGTKPALDSKGTKATYKVKKGERDIVFVKVDKYWYIRN